MTKGVVYYSDCRGDPAILESARRQLLRACVDLPVVAVTLAPVPAFTYNLVLPAERSRLTMFRQMLAGLEVLDTDVAFLCEHDCLYPPAHFAFDPPDAQHYFYDCAWYRVDAATGRAVTYLAQSVSGLCADRALLLDHYRRRVAQVERDGYNKNLGYEPGCHPPPRGLDAVPMARFWAEVPYLDIRHGCNLTASRWDPSQFYDKRTCTQWAEVDVIPHWGVAKGRFQDFLREVTA